MDFFFFFSCTPLPQNIISSHSILKHQNKAQQQYIDGGPILRHSGGRHFRDDDTNDEDDELDYFIIKKKPKKKRARKQKVIIELDSGEYRTRNVDVDYNAENHRDKYDDNDDDEDEYRNDNGANFADYRKRFRNSRLLNRKHGRRKQQQHDLAKKSFALDRQYNNNNNNEDDNDEDDIDGADGDLDNIDYDLANANDDETTAVSPTDDTTDRRTSLKRKNVRGSDIPAARYNNFNGIESQKLDRNYGSMFEDNFHNLKPTLATNGFNNREWPVQPQQPLQHLNHNLDTNRRWDKPYFSPYPTRPAFSNPVNFAEDFYRGGRTTDRTDGWPMNYFNATQPPSVPSFALTTQMPRTEIKNYGKEKAVFDMPSRFRRIYSKWSKWSKCTAKCTTRRFK